MKKIIVSILICALLLGSVNVFALYEVEYSAVVDNPDLLPIIKNASRVEQTEGLMYPPKEHPYIFVNDEYIAMLKANKGTDIYKTAYNALLALAKKDLPPQPEGGIIQAPITDQLNARAFMYVMGEVDKEHAKETIKYTLEYVRNAKTKETYSISIYKDFGTNAIMCGALVYDWCYDAMTAGQRADLAESVRTLMYASNQPCTPANAKTWTEINGNAVGQPLIYNSIAVSAFYDIYPDMYELVMPKVQGDMAEASKIFGEAGALTDGSIAYTREYYTYWVELLFQRMGHDISEKYGKQLPLGYKLLYSRTPYGMHIKQGDDFVHRLYNLGGQINVDDIAQDMGMLQVMFEDPYLKYYYIRDNYNSTNLFNMLLKVSPHESKMFDELPLAFEASEPRSEIIHKTSWQEGLDSPQVTAYMNMHNRRSGDHDHADLGTFQLYYKGPLSISQGVYVATDWGSEHWLEYAVRTVSKNGMLVYDKSETYTYGATIAEANDGGQKFTTNSQGGWVFTELEDHFSDANLWAITEGTYIGPNEMTPAFSYIKGDLTKAYNAKKMDEYDRAMVFMDTFNETYPGVLVTFDRVVSTNEGFPKTWLLQAVAEPTIEGNKMWFKNSDTNALCGGKLVNTVLYPENVEVSKVGGIYKYISEGKERPVSGDAKEDIFASGWRCEVKPATPAKEDLFLNAMFVADADTTAPDLEMIKVETDKLMGVATLDRQVMFSKSSRIIEDEFTFEVKDNNAGGNMLTLLTDLKPGKWNVIGGGIDVVLEAKEKDNAFAFEGKPGVYTVIPADFESTVTEIQWPEAKKEKIGDFSIKYGTSYQYLRDPSKLINGNPYVPESFLIHSAKLTTKRDGNTLTVTSSEGKSVILTAGSNEYKTLVNGIESTKNIDNAPFVDENGVFYVNLANGVSTFLGFSSTYSKVGNVLVCKDMPKSTGEMGKLEGVDESKVLWPIAITASSDDGNVPENLIDRNLSTRWSSNQGDGEWVCFNMGEEPVSISAVQIAFYNGDIRHWKFDIEISDDGETFTKVLENQRSAGESKNVETIKLPAGTKARFIRYVGHGEEVTQSLFNSVTEFIVLK